MLMLHTPEPVMRGDTNGALGAWAAELRCALRQANADKSALRAWAADMPYDPSGEVRCD